MLRHFSIPSWRIPSGFPKEIIIMDTMSAHGENLYFEGEGNILDIKSKLSIYVICFNCMFKGVMPHQRSTCKFISIYGTLLE